MDDRLFELIEKMYSDLKNEISEVKKDVTSVSNQLTVFENRLTPKVEAALDGVVSLTEKYETVDKKLDDLISKVDTQELEIKVIKGGKKY